MPLEKQKTLENFSKFAKNQVKAVNVAVLAALCNVLAAPYSIRLHLRGVLGSPHSVLALQDTHGTSRGGLRDPRGGGGLGTIHEKFLWSRIA